MNKNPSPGVLVDPLCRRDDLHADIELIEMLLAGELWLEGFHRAFTNGGFRAGFLENLGTDNSWVAALTCTGCQLADDSAVARRQIVDLLANNGLLVDIETVGLLHRVGDKLVVSFQFPYGRPGVLRVEPETVDGQGMLFAPTR